MQLSAVRGEAPLTAANCATWRVKGQCHWEEGGQQGGGDFGSLKAKQLQVSLFLSEFKDMLIDFGVGRGREGRRKTSM